MSRSRKKTPIGGITMARSEKEDKQVANRKVRRVAKEVLSTSPEPEVLPHIREISNTWTMAKDGKAYFGRIAEAKKYLRK